MAKNEVTPIRMETLAEKLPNGPKRKDDLKKKKTGDGQIEYGDLALKILIGPLQVFGGAQDMGFFELALANRHIL